MKEGHIPIRWDQPIGNFNQNLHIIEQCPTWHKCPTMPVRNKQYRHRCGYPTCTGIVNLKPEPIFFKHSCPNQNQTYRLKTTSFCRAFDGPAWGKDWYTSDRNSPAPGCTAGRFAEPLYFGLRNQAFYPAHPCRAIRPGTKGSNQFQCCSVRSLTMFRCN